MALTLVLESDGFVQAQRSADDATGFNRLAKRYHGGIAHLLALAISRSLGGLVVIACLLQHRLVEVQTHQTRCRVNVGDFRFLRDSASRKQHQRGGKEWSLHANALIQFRCSHPTVCFARQCPE